MMIKCEFCGRKHKLYAPGWYSDYPTYFCSKYKIMRQLRNVKWDELIKEVKEEDGKSEGLDS